MLYFIPSPFQYKGLLRMRGHIISYNDKTLFLMQAGIANELTKCFKADTSKALFPIFTERSFLHLLTSR